MKTLTIHRGVGAEPVHIAIDALITYDAKVQEVVDAGALFDLLWQTLPGRTFDRLAQLMAEKVRS